MSLIKIEINNLFKQYHSNKIFINYSLVIDNSNYNIIYGLNGSGKTTLIRCLINFCRYKGTIKVNSIQDNYSFAYMPEKIIYPGTVKLMNFLSLITSTNKIKNRNNIDYYITLFNLNDHLKKRINQLSLGTLKKISLIKTLMEDVDIYIFDEPLNGLDYQSIIVFQEELKKLKAEEKLIIIISHNIEMLKLPTYRLVEIKNEQK